MHILFLLSSLSHGGAERTAAILSTAWAERGHTVTLMTTFSSRGEISYPIGDDVVVDHLADHVNGRIGRAQRLLALRRHIKRQRPDVIVSFLSHVNIAALLATLGLNVPVIACERTYPPHLQPPLSTGYEWARRCLYPRARLLCAQTEDTADWMRVHFPKTPRLVVPNPVVLPLPAKPPFIAPDGVIAREKKLLLAVGRLDPPKRHEMLIQAFASSGAGNTDWQLVVLGEGPSRSDLEALTAKLGLNSRVLLPGFAGNLADWYRRADLFVLPSSYEGFPNALLEAAAHGTACIAFDVKAGPRDILGTGSAQGILLPDDEDPLPHLTEALKRLTGDHAARIELAAKALRVRDLFDLEVVLELWDKALSQARGQH